MGLTPITCPTGHETAGVKHGQTSDGQQRFYGQNALWTRQTLLREYGYPGKLPDITQQMVDMTMHGRGMRDLARVLHVSPTTVLETLQKKNQKSKP